MQLKQLYYIVDNVCSRKNATYFDLPYWSVVPYWSHVVYEMADDETYI